MYLYNVMINVPIWVWPLFILLVFLGIRSSRERTVPIYPFYMFPLLGSMGLGRINQLPFNSIAWTTFTVAFAIGAISGSILQDGWIVLRTDSKVTVKGEWFTLTTLMLIFGANFASGFVQAVLPEIYETKLFIMILVSALGFASGTFLGRTISVLKFPRPVQ